MGRQAHEWIPEVGYVTRLVVLSGTGMDALASDMVADGTESSEIRIDSQWGQVPAILVDTGDGEVLFIDRHHRDDDSRTPPHEIEYRANVHAAASFRPDLILSVNSVGTMREDLPPGMIGLLRMFSILRFDRGPFTMMMRFTPTELRFLMIRAVKSAWKR